MRRHRLEEGTINGIAEATAERVRLGGELLQAMARALAANEKAQRKFRYAVIKALSDIKVTVTMIHALQIVDTHGTKPGFEERVREQAADAEKYISEQSYDFGLRMAKHIYGEDPAPEPRRDRRRKWTDWEI